MDTRCAVTLRRESNTRHWSRLVAVFALASASACVPKTSYEDIAEAVRDGDLIFHESSSAQSEAIRAATHSEYSHMGMVFGAGTRHPIVLEAVQPVRETPLRAWVERGRRHHFVIKRLRRTLTQADAQALRTAARRFLGRSYDSVFDWTDARIYCSELAWKAYDRALHVHIGEPEAWRTLDLDGSEVQRLIAKRLGHDPNPDDLVITPIRMMESQELVEVLRGEMQ